MNQSLNYRGPLPHQTPCPVQGFPARFPGTPNGLNPLLSQMGHPDPQYHSHVAPFVNSRPIEHLKASEQQKVVERNNFNLQQQQPSSQQQQNNERDNQPTTSTQPTSQENQFTPSQCSQGTKDCIQCFKGQPQTQQTTAAAATTTTRNGKVMVDVATMTDLDEIDQMANWQNAAIQPNNKVAEYLTSLRQFLKLSNPPETKRKLGDVRIVTSPDGSRLYCCPECHMAYPDKSLLEPHLAAHKIERRFVCGVCGAGLKRKEHLDRHQLSHSDERPYSCAACPKAFKRNEHLTRHYTVHTGEKGQMERRFGVCGLRGGTIPQSYFQRPPQRQRASAKLQQPKLPLNLF